ncbi:MAG: redoxin domain-containing protein [Cyclobacteriaceae bacterium]|nr:redoxin domain-containing protein [Cyclobacteriaceae bacterium]
MTTISLFSCQQKNEKEQGTPEAIVAFKPNPKLVPKQEVTTLPIGAAAPDFSLPDVSGRFLSLQNFKDAKALVIIFTCNHCPTAQAYEDRLIQFTSDYQAKGVSVVAIMPNSVLGLLPEECGYTDLNDTYEEMKIRAQDKGYNFTYLYDGDNQAVSIQYGPVATPHAFVFDQERKLRYVGRIDAIEKPGKANADDLRLAVDAILENRTVENPENKAFGCSTKWGWKNDWGKQVEKEWNEKPVTLELADVEAIKQLVKNPSKKLRLINVWATWCAPCVAEYPELVALQRWYGARDFEFISLSADKPEHRDKALAFLEQKRSPVKNYLYSGEDNYKLIEAVDPAWNGALPYTLLLEPGGKVVYRYQGVVDLLELRKAIVDHPMMGRYY